MNIVNTVRQRYLVVIFLVLVIACLALGSWLYGAYHPEQASLLKIDRNTNIILISIDTLRPDHLGIYGYPERTSPNIDKWAKQSGYIFENAYTLTPITYPSFATLMSGISPYANHIYNNGRIEQNEKGEMASYSDPGFNPISESTDTIASTLKSNGYSTAAFNENYALRNIGTNIGKGFDIYQVSGEEKGANKGGSVTDRALAYMDTARGKSNPFFLWVHYIDPHEAYKPREENACKFNDKYCDEINTTGIETLADRSRKLSGCQIPSLEKDQVEIQEALYDGEIYQTDTSVGRLLSFIKEKSLDENSIIILYSDHGEGFDHNYYFTHSDVLYESAVKIALIISLPGGNNGNKRITTTVTNEQVYPTLLSLLGISSNKSSQSFKNMFSLSNNALKSDDKAAPIFYVNQNASKFAIRKGNYKYIYTMAQRSTSCLSQQSEELYDVVTDPNETKNLAGQIISVKENLKALLLKRMEESNVMVKTGMSEPTITPPANEEEEQILKSLREMGY